MIFQILERALEECGNDIDAAIKRLNELHIGYGDENAAPDAEPNDIVQKGMMRLFCGCVWFPCLVTSWNVLIFLCYLARNA